MDCTFFLCGPLPMIEAVERALPYFKDSTTTTFTRNNMKWPDRSQKMDIQHILERWLVLGTVGFMPGSGSFVCCHSIPGLF